MKVRFLYFFSYFYLKAEACLMPVQYIVLRDKEADMQITVAVRESSKNWVKIHCGDLPGDLICDFKLEHYETLDIVSLNTT